MEIIALLQWGKTRDLFKKIRDTKGKFHIKMGTINNRKSVDPTEEEDTCTFMFIEALFIIASFVHSDAS